MIAHSLTVTAGVTGLALMARLWSDAAGSKAQTEERAQSLVSEALHYRAMHSDRWVNRLEDAVTAAAFFEAARTILSDDELERACELDVARTARQLQRKVHTLKKEVQSSCPK